MIQLRSAAVFPDLGWIVCLVPVMRNWPCPFPCQNWLFSMCWAVCRILKEAEIMVEFPSQRKSQGQCGKSQAGVKNRRLWKHGRHNWDLLVGEGSVKEGSGAAIVDSIFSKILVCHHHDHHYYVVFMCMYDACWHSYHDTCGGQRTLWNLFFLSTIM